MKVIGLTVVLCVGMLFGCGSDGGGGGGGSTSNDRVLHGGEFTEVFKDDGDGKNYLYTITEFDNQKGEHCTVITGNSEQTVALQCTPKAGS